MKLKEVEIGNANSERLCKHCVRIQGELLGFSSSRAIDDKRPAKFVSSTTPPSLCLAAYYNYCILCYTEPRRVVSSVLKQQQLRRRWRRRRCDGGGSRRGRVYPPAAALLTQKWHHIKHLELDNKSSQSVLLGSLKSSFVLGAVSRLEGCFVQG